MTPQKTPQAKQETDRIKIEGVEGFEGTYDFDVDALLVEDIRTIKRISGVRVNELDDAFAAGDIEVMIAVGTIALAHAGHPHASAFDRVVSATPVAQVKITYEAADKGEETDAADPLGNGELDD